MSHIIATCFNKVVVELTNLENGVSEPFFPIKRHLPQNPNSQSMCLGLISDYFIHVLLPDEFPIPPLCMKCKLHKIDEVLSKKKKIDEAEIWEDTFLDI
jgi:hypothetical protein